MRRSRWSGGLASSSGGRERDRSLSLSHVPRPDDSETKRQDARTPASVHQSSGSWRPGVQAPSYPNYRRRRRRVISSAPPLSNSPMCDNDAVPPDGAPRSHEQPPVTLLVRPSPGDPPAPGVLPPTPLALPPAPAPVAPAAPVAPPTPVVAPPVPVAPPMPRPPLPLPLVLAPPAPVAPPVPLAPASVPPSGPPPQVAGPEPTSVELSTQVLSPVPPVIVTVTLAELVSAELSVKLTPPAGSV